MLLPAARSKTILLNKNAGFVRTAARFLLRIACLAVVLIAIYPDEIKAQEPTPDDDEVVKVNTDLLVYPIRVRDKRRPAAGSLTERDLTLKDDDLVCHLDHQVAGEWRIAEIAGGAIGRGSHLNIEWPLAASGRRHHDAPAFDLDQYVTAIR